MPYIKKDIRKLLEFNTPACFIVKGLLIHGLRGNLNYFIFLLYRKYVRNKGESYAITADFLSELHECEEEIRRRFMVPYEDKKINENGDVRHNEGFIYLK